MKHRTLLFLCPLPLAAQSLIVGVPSTDVTPRGRVMIAHESQYNRFRSTPNYWNSFTFGTVGIAPRTELAVTALGVSRPASGNRAVAIGFKHHIPVASVRDGRWEVAASVGAMTPVSLDGQGVGYWLYGNMSLKLPTKTRFTAGPSQGSRQMFGRNTYATMIGFEQPLNRQFSLICDWYTGTHDLAAAIFGIGWHPNPDFMLIAGWKTPNNARSGKPAMMVEVTYTFGLRKGARSH